MASPTTLNFYFVLTFLVFAYCCYGIEVDFFNHSLDAFSPAIATWYGSAIPTGGACGYDKDVEKPPYSGFITAGNPALFKNGKGCGACYEVKCTDNPACSGSPVTVTLADSCPGCDGSVHFDLGRFAFGALAKRGQGNKLRDAGKINVLYQKVACKYPGFNIVFKVDNGSSQYFFSVLIEFVKGNGEIGSVQIKGSNANSWLQMDQNFGAHYKFNASVLKPPFSIRLTQSGSRTVTAQNVIPVNWKPGQSYRSNVNF